MAIEEIRTVEDAAAALFTAIADRLDGLRGNDKTTDVSCEIAAQHAAMAILRNNDAMGGLRALRTVLEQAKNAPIHSSEDFWRRIERVYKGRAWKG